MATARDNLARKQIYIPATQPEEEIVLRVAAYCRVSTDSDDQLNSFTAQNAHYNNLIKSHDRWELADIYADEGITGTSAKKRGDFQRMLEDCRKGKIDKILVKSISRFARNTKDCLEAVRELRTLGISIFFEEHNIDWGCDVPKDIYDGLSPKAMPAEQGRAGSVLRDQYPSGDY